MQMHNEEQSEYSKQRLPKRLFTIFPVGSTSEHFRIEFQMTYLR